MTLNQKQSWHALEGEAAGERLQSPAEGLSSAEAQQRLAAQGPNRLTPPRRRGPLLRLLAQCHNVLIYVLLAAAGITALLGHWIDTGVIVGVVVINALIGFVQEGKAEKALEAIRDLLAPRAAVWRDGHIAEIAVEDIVPGDRVVLNPGDKVPADLRLLRARNLRIDEATLTGESMSVEKDTGAVAEAAVLAERTGMAYAGTLVTYGQATGVVVATGDDTELGRINALLRDVTTLTTPLLAQLAVFGRWLTAAILVLSAATFAFGTLVWEFAAAEMFLAAVGLAVAAIPEGLPAVMTITLAIGVQRMAGRNAIIRRLPAVETLGSVAVICSDKTGTLTRNEMTVQRVVTASQEYTVSGLGYGPQGNFSRDGSTLDPEGAPELILMLQAGMLCNDARVQHSQGLWLLEGDPTEGALLAAAAKAGLDAAEQQRRLPRTDIIPFESERAFMATLHHDHEGHGFICLKGAPERVLALCQSVRTADGEAALDTAFWERALEQIAAAGQRTLAVARRDVPAGQSELSLDDVAGGFTLLGLFGITDPPREEAITAVELCRSAGIRVKMITGDHAITARAIGRQLGIGDGEHALSGRELDTIDDASLRAQVLDVDVFARASPEHKLRIVEALQSHGAVVAMTGDGVNDAPALKRANVGIAMGQKGTEVAKEAAEMVLADDNFASIANAVEEGRTVHDNLKKALLFILPTNGGQAFMLITAILLGYTLPITAPQILWVNMITAVTLALALTFEPSEPDIMSRPPRRPDEPLLSALLLWRIVFVSAIMVVAGFWLFQRALDAGYSLEYARTLAVNTVVMVEIFYLLSTRSFARSVFAMGVFAGNPWVAGAIGLVLVLQVLFTYAPFMQFLFGTEAIAGQDLLILLVIGVSALVLVELEKWLLGRFSASKV